ncbi:fasciclin domain-containing protein [Flavihumibacter rivuli]|uniref:fasciclin domain-containing protein n=1 Tax=Flavihumibacter rivuli TaxID=2838156 RepID=UPI001BDDCE1A|nr:fasciclin domain-containing protein [Flavihumibacter rivuli]ULQ57980.1 fasciclin domain-containing protein [Flavihumibacter rivuli]
MKRMMSIMAVALTCLFFCAKVSAQTADLVDVAAGSKDHSTLVSAVKAAGLVNDLKAAGPFTVFAPTNEAFNKLPAGVVESLLQPENKEVLAKVLKNHVVAGKLDAAAVTDAIKQGNGKAVFNTLSGGKLTAVLEGGRVKLTDEGGRSSYIVTPDIPASNGMVHVVDAVVMPK